MDAHRITVLLRSLSASPSRRGVVALLAGAVVGGMPGLRAVSGAPKKKGKRKGKKKKKRRDEPTLAPPPAPGPVITYQCPGPAETPFSASPNMRIAQVFTTTRSGTLREIQFQITKTAGVMGDFLVELLEAAIDVPTNTVLAARSIANSSVPDGSATLIATFNGPQLEAGTQYAAALTAPSGGSLLVAIRLGNDCTGLPYTQLQSGMGTFTEHTFGGHPSFITSVTVIP